MAHIPGWFHISGIQLASVGFSWHQWDLAGMVAVHVAQTKIS